MSELSEIIAEKIRNGEFNHNVEPPKEKKKNIIIRILLWPIKMMGAILGVDEETISKGTTNVSTNSQPVYTSQTDNSFAERINVQPGITPYTFNPVAADNLRIYLQGADGRGDPPEPPHDHDDR